MMLQCLFVIMYGVLKRAGVVTSTCGNHMLRFLGQSVATEVCRLHPNFEVTKFNGTGNHGFG
jgi:hypothetical protein